jgi:hypothetical protein
MNEKSFPAHWVRQNRQLHRIQFSLASLMSFQKIKCGVVLFAFSEWVEKSEDGNLSKEKV